MRIDELARYLEVPCKVVSIVCTRKERYLVIANRIRKLSSTKGGVYCGNDAAKITMNDECSMRLEPDKVRLDDVE